MSNLSEKLNKVGQSHLLQFYADLSAENQVKLVEQIESINLDALPGLVEQYIVNPTAEELPSEINPREI